MEGMKHKNEVDQFCKDSPDGKHCWHSLENNSWSINMMDESICCWCGIKVEIHGKFKPSRPAMSVRFTGEK